MESYIIMPGEHMVINAKTNDLYRCIMEDNCIGTFLPSENKSRVSELLNSSDDNVDYVFTWMKLIFFIILISFILLICNANKTVINNNRYERKQFNYDKIPIT